MPVCPAVSQRPGPAHWRIGQRIHTQVLEGRRADYGEEVVLTLAAQLVKEYGGSFAVKNLRRMVQFATAYPDAQRMSPALVMRDPYILDFLGLRDTWQESDLEAAIIREMESFLLELGAGFSCVARQKRIPIDDEDFHLDLLFYNRKLRRLVAVELKVGEFKAAYKGQMELYLRWLDKHEREPEEASPLGIILCTGKKREQIELLELDKSGIHVAEYLTALPPRGVLVERLQQATQRAQLQIEQRKTDTK
ncbi:PDDEXK nuclease domain-containing protein [Castellaniella hirudinis]|uniref:PDDEXK nuclease domain-containing protein n=1 Tax=Castellaniella hirudinis TaxID=1144617 RepID=A0ABV8RYV7_9BURK